MSNRLTELEDLISTQPALDRLDELNRTKFAIESMYNDRARGCIIRARSKFIEKYEKPPKFFFNFEKANSNLKKIRSLVINNEIINKPDKILAQKDFYSNLYTCPHSEV